MTSASGRGVPLAALVASLGDAHVDGPLDRPVFALAHDSRRVSPGTLFVALRGERADGHAFVAAALSAGASAAVVDAAFARDGLPAGATVVTVADTRPALARLAAEFYGQPAQALHVLGVTGTNGKTTTTSLLQAILSAAGLPCGRIGTLGAEFGGVLRPLENTTPLALELQATLADMRERGARAVALEVSSHALALGRTAEIAFEAAALTNVTRDHLDFHGTFEAYAAAKRSLFERARYAAFCSDDALGARWAREFAQAHGTERVATFGLDEGAQLRPGGVVVEGGRSSFMLDGTRFTLPLPGRFNVRNALAAIALARRLDVSDALSAEALAAVGGVAGRMEYVGADGIDVLVDYAHTPDALANVLSAARELGRGRLIAVFGCGGDRDRGKRPEMGAVAAAAADDVVLTSDNPRGEDPGTILADIAAGIPPGARYAIEPDRARAIERAIFGAVPGDVVVIAGKGHETYQIAGAQTLHFDDREVAREALARRARASLAVGGGRA